MLKIGAVEIYPLTDAQGTFPRKLDELFPDVDPEQWKPYRRRYPQVFVNANTWHCHYGCFLLKTENRNILVDTGIGSGPADPRYGGIEGGLVDRLADAGVERDQVDTVFFTHLHWDHVSGGLRGGEPTFPKATYFLHQADWDFLRAGWCSTSPMMIAPSPAPDTTRLMLPGLWPGVATAVMSVISSYIPARRIAGIDPAVVFRA